MKTVRTPDRAMQELQTVFRESYRGMSAWHIFQNKATEQQRVWTTLQKFFTGFKSLWAVIKFCYLRSMYDVWSDMKTNLRWILEVLGVFQAAESIWCDTSSRPLHIQCLRCNIKVLLFGRMGTASIFQSGLNASLCFYASKFDGMIIFYPTVFTIKYEEVRTYSIIKSTEYH